MPRSSRHKSHKQSKHSSKDARDYSDSEEDGKTKERSNREEDSGRVSKDLVSGEKRKLTSQSRDGKDLSVHGNGDASEEYVPSKRRKEKLDGSDADRWNGGDGRTTDKELKGDSSRNDLDKGLDKGLKSKESKTVSESKSKSSRRHDSGGQKKDRDNGGLVAEKEDAKTGNRVESKRKSEKDSERKEGHQHKESKESKEKDYGLEKSHDNKRDTEEKRKQGSLSIDIGDDRRGKRGRENAGEVRNSELDKELEKKMRRRKDDSADKDMYQDDVRGSTDRRLSSKAEGAKDSSFMDERQKDGSCGDEYLEVVDVDDRHRDSRLHQDSEKDSRHRDVKYREDGGKDSKHRDATYRGDGDGDKERDGRHKDDKYHEDKERDNKRRDTTYQEDGNRESRHKEKKYLEDGDKDNRRSDNRYHEDDERDDRYKDDKYREDRDRENRYKKEKRREDVDRNNRYRDDKQGDDNDREKRNQDVKYRDEHAPRVHTRDKSDSKRLRDDASDIFYRKSHNRDGSPSYDGRSSRYKDELGKKRLYEKEDQSDIRSRSTKEQRPDVEKRSVSSKLDLVTDKGRSSSRNPESDFSMNHSRRRSSPSSTSHAPRDLYRFSKQEDPNCRDYPQEGRVRHNAMSSREYGSAAGVIERIPSRSTEKPSQKADNYLDDLSAERRLKSDARGSPFQLVDKSPSSTSAERRHLNRCDVRRSLDVEESGQRSGASKEAKDLSGKEGRGSRELPLENFPVDELSQADGDTLSVSSPFPRTSNFSGNSKSLLPPPPLFRTGLDNSPVGFGFSEDDSRGKSNNRYRRMNDLSMGRMQGNSAWRGVPNWGSPLPSGFMHFQHGPPVGFHSMMPQYPSPPLFGVRPSMELNHAGLPYHIPDADRFSGHGRPPPLHGWDTNNAPFGDEPYGRVEWDHSRTLSNNKGWESSRDMWKGQNNGLSLDMSSAQPVHGSADEAWAGEGQSSVQKDHSHQNRADVQESGNEVSVSKSDAIERNTPEVLEIVSVEDLPDDPKISEKDDASLCDFYLSKLDISDVLTQPELYEHCMSRGKVDQGTMYDEDNSKILYVEEVVETKAIVPGRTSTGFLFAASSDSTFQKAMSLYKKQREAIWGTTSREQVHVSPIIEKPTSADNDNPEEEEVEEKEEEELTLAIDQPNPDQKVEAEMEETAPTSNAMEMEIDSVPIHEKMECKIETEVMDVEKAEGSIADEINGSKESGVVGNNEEERSIDDDNKCESIESLSRIHHSPTESTH